MFHSIQEPLDRGKNGRRHRLYCTVGVVVPACCVYARRHGVIYTPSVEWGGVETVILLETYRTA